MGTILKTQMGGKKRASIIIFSTNEIDYVKQCLPSVYQDIGPNDEVILVDNASTDGLAEWVKEKWPEVKVVRNVIKQGFTFNGNLGANYATGQYLVFLNPDTRVFPGWLDGLLDVLESDENIAMTTSKLLLMSQPDKIQVCGTDLHYSGLSFSRGFLENGDKYTEQEVVGAVCGGSFAISQKMWKNLGGFDPELFIYFEDTSLSWRAQLAGYQCVYVPTSVAVHDYPLTPPSPWVLYYTSRNRYIMLLKCWRWPTFLVLLPGLVLAEFLEWGYIIMIGWPCVLAKLRGYGWLLLNFPKIIRNRQVCQSIRQVPDWVILKDRVWTVTAVLQTGGLLGRTLIRLANILLFANGWAAMRLCRFFKW